MTISVHSPFAVHVISPETLLITEDRTPLGGFMALPGCFQTSPLRMLMTRQVGAGLSS